MDGKASPVKVNILPVADLPAKKVPGPDGVAEVCRSVYRKKKQLILLGYRLCGNDD